MTLWDQTNSWKGLSMADLVVQGTAKVEKGNLYIIGHLVQRGPWLGGCAAQAFGISSIVTLLGLIEWK